MNILITHVFGFANKGDWVLLEALLDTIREVFPDARVFGLCREPIQQSKVFPTVKWIRQAAVSNRSGISRRIESLADVVGVCTRFLFCRDFHERTEDLPAAYRHADLVVTCPGGYLEDSNISIATNLLHIWFAVAVQKPIVVAPQSIGPFRSRFWQRLSGSVLRRTSIVCVREQFSREVVTQQLRLPPEKSLLLPDMAFYNADVASDEAGAELARLGLEPGTFGCATAIDWYFPFDPSPRTASAKYISEFARTIRLVYERLGLKTLVLKQVERSAGTAGDDVVMQQVATMAGDACVFSLVNYRPALMRGIISRSRFFLGSRMHSTIFALQVGVPTVAIGYLPKTRGIMCQFGLGAFVLDISDLKADVALRRILCAMADPARFVAVRQSIKGAGGRGRSEFVRLLRSVVP